jgi:P-type E1-E2 ATPase
VSTPATPDTASLSIEIDGKRAAIIGLRETQRPHASAIPEALGSIGIDMVLMTGDRWEHTSQFAFPNTYAALGPDEKLAFVRSWNQDGRHILFVGDGMNDAAAMAVSDVAIVVGAEPGMAQEVASLVWPEPRFDRLPRAITICRDTVRVVRLNLRFALVYNLFGMAIAACGLLHPVIAALLMAISSCVVTLRSLPLLDAGRSLAPTGSSDDAQ